MSRVRIRPDRLRQFGAQYGECFYLVVTPELLPDVEVAPPSAYGEHTVVTLRADTPLGDLLAERVPEGAHVLVIAPRRVIVSPRCIGRRKLVVLPCGSTDSSLKSISASITAAEATDPRSQEARAATFFHEAERAPHLEIVDPAFETRAVFRHHDPTHAWNAQLGFVGWGQQQILPSGEISVLPAGIMAFDHARRFALTGDLTFIGEPIVHRGFASSSSSQSVLYRAICGLRNSPVVAHVRDGVIGALHATSPHSSEAARALSALIERDERYCIVWEIGVGMNERLTPVPENCATNEVYGGANGRVHIGIGLTTATEYALTFPCNGSILRTSTGMTLAGEAAPPERPGLRVVRNARVGCGCVG